MNEGQLAQTLKLEYVNTKTLEPTANLKRFHSWWIWASCQIQQKNCLSQMLAETYRFTAPEEMVIMRPKLDLHHVSPAHRQAEDSKELLGFLKVKHEPLPISI